MVKQLKINGIRLNNDFVQVCQDTSQSDGRPPEPLYLTMGFKRINMVFLILNKLGGRPFIAGTIAAGQSQSLSDMKPDWACKTGVSTISIFPHRSRPAVLGRVLRALGDLRLGVLNMSSSNSMLTLVVPNADENRCVQCLCRYFDLPETKVIIEQPEEKEELSQFIKLRYPQTRASYNEETIKTYGIAVTRDLSLGTADLTDDQLIEIGLRMESAQEAQPRFLYAAAGPGGPEQTFFCCVADQPVDFLPWQTRTVDMLSFHGPHFGDRYNIAGRALDCLSDHQINVLHAGCTGASITLIVPQGEGRGAKKALSQIFEVPE